VSVQRNLDDERERLRSRSEQATAKQHERQAVLLDGGANKRTASKAARPVPSQRAHYPAVRRSVYVNPRGEASSICN